MYIYILWLMLFLLVSVLSTFSPYESYIVVAIVPHLELSSCGWKDKRRKKFTLKHIPSFLLTKTHSTSPLCNPYQNMLQKFFYSINMNRKIVGYGVKKSFFLWTNVELWKSSFSSSLSHIIEGYFSQSRKKETFSMCFSIGKDWCYFSSILHSNSPKKNFPENGYIDLSHVAQSSKGVMWCRMRIITCNIANKIYILTIISPSPCSTNAAQHPRNETTRTITASAMRM